MRKFSIVLLLGALVMSVSCMDLKGLYDRIDTLEGKVGELEKLQLAELSNTVNGLSTTVGQLEKKVYVESVTETANGYVIKFTDGKTATIKDGEDGEDATTPTIGVKDEDGVLVWTVNGDVVKDAQGKSVPASVSVPEFKFENNKWWYRFGDKDAWKDCGEKTGPEPSITETDDYVIISIGDKKVQIPKEVVSPAIESLNPVITIGAKRLFVPIGGTLDLKDWFTVEPEGALKTMVDYTYPENAPFTVSEKGILNVTGAGSYTVTISAKVNPDLKTDIVIRSAPCPNDVVPQRSIDPEEKVMIFEGSLDEYNSLSEFGGTTTWNPFDNSLAAIFNGAWNFRIGIPVQANDKITMENGRLHFMFYVPDISYLPNDDSGWLELTSSGVWDADELDFTSKQLFAGMKNGWNEVDLKLSDGRLDAGNFDPTKANFIRLVLNNSATPENTYQPFFIKDLFVYVDDSKITEIKHSFVHAGSRLFVPVGQTVDLKDYFEVVPAKVGKEKVVYTPADGAAFTVSQDGVLSATGAGASSVVISSADNPDVKVTIYVRTATCPDNTTPEVSIDPSEKIMIFDGSFKEYTEMINFSGTAAWNPINNSLAGVFNGAWNFRVGMPVTPNPNITMENGHLHMLFYVADISWLNPNDDPLFELTSSGANDADEINWTIKQFANGLKNGWNEVDLKFSDAHKDAGNFDPSKANFIRIVNNTATTPNGYEGFQFKKIFVYAEEAPAKITIDGEFSDWDAVSAQEGTGDRVTEWKIASDADNIYLYFKVPKSVAKTRGIWNAYMVAAFDTDNDATTGGHADYGLNDGWEAVTVSFPFSNAAGEDAALATSANSSSFIKYPVDTVVDQIETKGAFSGDYALIEYLIPRNKIGSPASGQKVRVRTGMASQLAAEQVITLK